MDIFRGMRRIARASAGNIAMVFALCVVPICMLAGAAIDIKQHTDRKAVVQSALDMAGLAAARAYQLDATTTQVELQDLAQTFFTEELSQFPDISMTPLTLSVRTDDHLELSVDGDVEPGIMASLGVNAQRRISAESTINAATSTGPIEVALVLDTTDSMSGVDRIDVLKTIATDFVTTLVDPTSDKRKVAIVPFNEHIRIDTSLASETWLQVEADTVHPINCRSDAAWRALHCPLGYDGKGRNKGRTRAHHGMPLCSIGEWNSAPRICDSETHTWHGCVRPRVYPRNIEDRGFLTHKVQGFVTRSEAECASEIVELTNDRDSLITAIDALTPRDYTYIPSGLSWGRRVLSKEKPFDQGEDASDLAAAYGRKVLILMTDGVNTFGANASGEVVPNDPSLVVKDANVEMSEVCDAIKDDDIIVFSIAFDLDTPFAKDLVRDCASSVDFFFDAADADALEAAFATIKQVILTDIAVTS